MRARAIEKLGNLVIGKLKIWTQFVFSIICGMVLNS